MGMNGFDHAAALNICRAVLAANPPLCAQIHDPDIAHDLASQLWLESDRFDPAKGKFSNWCYSPAHARLIDRPGRVQTRRKYEVVGEIADIQPVVFEEPAGGPDNSEILEN